MALPSSGQLSLSQIAQELQQATSNCSLRNLSSIAGKSTPDAVSEFYGYTSGGGGGGGPKYEAVMFGVALGDTCSGNIVNVYVDPATREYVYSSDERTYYPFRKPQFVYSPDYQDYYTGEWYWTEILVYSWGYEYYGTYISYCGPY